MIVQFMWLKGVEIVYMPPRNGVFERNNGIMMEVEKLIPVEKGFRRLTGKSYFYLSVFIESSLNKNQLSI